MEEKIKKAKATMLECWFIFSKTGNCQDARMLVDAMREYDMLLEDEFAREM